MFKEANTIAKLRYITKTLKEQGAGTSKNLLDAAAIEREHSRRKRSSLIDFCTKIAMALPNPGQIRSSARGVGAFKGMASNNWLKPPGGSMKSTVTNPRMSLSNSMTKANRT